MAVVYKICHKSALTDDCYVGSTFRMRARKAEHICHSKTVDKEPYRTINSTGGWDNWDFHILEEVKIDESEHAPSKKFQLLHRERKWIEELKPTLNSLSSIGRDCIHKNRKSTCKICNGAEICTHGKRKQICKECGGISLCIHGSQKIKCARCGGNGICFHGKRKERCVICEPEKYTKYLANEKAYRQIQKNRAHSYIPLPTEQVAR